MYQAITRVPVTSNTLYISLEIIVGVVVSVIYIRSRVPKETILEQAALIKVLQQKSNEQGLQLSDYKAQLAKLEGQLETYKELPLRELAVGMQNVSDATTANAKLISDIAESNKEIVKQLKITADIAAEDREGLTHPNTP